MPTIFERIAAGEIPCHKVWEDERHLAFLDINPRIEGHTLVIPKRTTDYLFNMKPADYRALWDAVAATSVVLTRATDCTRVVLWVYGYEVPHVHVHLLPTKSIGDVPFPPLDEDAKANLAAFARRFG